MFTTQQCQCLINQGQGPRCKNTAKKGQIYCHVHLKTCDTSSMQTIMHERQHQRMERQRMERQRMERQRMERQRMERKRMERQAIDVNFHIKMNQLLAEFNRFIDHHISDQLYETLPYRKMLHQFMQFYVYNNPNKEDILSHLWCGQTIVNIGQYNSGIDYGCLDEHCSKCMVIKKLSYQYEFFAGYPPNQYHPINIEIDILKFVTNHINLTNMSPHITMFYGNYNVPKYTALCVEALTTEIDGYIYNNFEQYLDRRLAIEKGTKSYLGRESNIVVLIFQVIYTVACLHRFQIMHHDLKPDNILLRFTQDCDPNIPVYHEYVIDNVHYYLPAIGIIAKLWDFGLSWSPHFRNRFIESGSYENYGQYPNFTTSFDIHFFLNYLHTSFRRQLSKDIINFIERHIPIEWLGGEKSGVLSYNRYIDSQNPTFIRIIPTPEILLDDFIFAEFKVKPKGHVIETYTC